MLSNKHATILRDLAIRCLIFDADGNVIGAPADFDHNDIEDALDALDEMNPSDLGACASAFMRAGLRFIDARAEQVGPTEVASAEHESGAMAIFTRGQHREALLAALPTWDQEPVTAMGPSLLDESDDEQPCGDDYAYALDGQPVDVDSLVQISRPLEGLSDMVDRTTMRAVHGGSANPKPRASPISSIVSPANTPPKRVRVCTIDNPVSAVVVFSTIVRHTMSGSELSVMSLDEEMTLPGGACIVRTADGWTLWREETDR